MCAAYFPVENSSGRIPERLSQLGYDTTYPEQLLVALMRGNIHAFFGDWRDPVIKIGGSAVVWLGFLLLVATIITLFKAPS